MPEDVFACVDHITIAPSPGGSRLGVTVTLSAEFDDAAALDLILEAAGALARMRGEGD
jgi:hypothetical protein